MQIDFLGDISLNDDYIKLYKEGINPFKEIEPTLAKADFVVGNLECMAKGDKGENELKKPRLATTVETLNYLNNIRLKVACLAQNHVYDHLEDGFSKTVDFLKANEIFFLGAGFSPDEAAKPIILKQDEISIGLLNYVTSDTNPNLPEDASVFLNMFDLEKCKNDIMRLRTKVNHVVLLLHWGGRVEGGLYPDWEQPIIARNLIDAGADLIIGHHSHTIQPFEVYKKKYIFYSLGNFCFTDVVSDGKISYKNAYCEKTSIIPVVLIENNQLRITIWRTLRDREGNIKIIQNGFFLQNLFFKILFSLKMFWHCYYWWHKHISPIYKFIIEPTTLSNKVTRIRIKIKNLFNTLLHSKGF